MHLSSFRYISILTYILGGIPVSFRTPLGYVLGIIIMILATVIAFQYKCPRCNSKFDLRMSKSKLYYCPSCGNKVDWY